ncbi:MAG: Lipoyl-binding protein, partial [Chloroflexota bacterium]|nr:Lipoyl-binding protein [Chloroflexota bacterium]
MPEPQRPSERTAAERQADHAGLARLSETLVTALVQKLNGSGLGELEVREGDWKIRLRRPTGAAAATRRERPRTGGHAAPRPV